MKQLRVWGFAAMGLMLVIAAPSPATVSTIFNTGTDSNDLVIASGMFEQHYTITPGGPGIVDSGVSATPTPDSISQWIRPTSNVGPGSYGYDTTFTATSADPITINGQWAAYFSGVDISLNGVSSGQTIAGPGDSWHNFTISGTTLVGTNTLEFRAAEDFGNPTTGLRVEITSVTPEPTSLALFCMVYSSGLLSRRRK